VKIPIPNHMNYAFDIVIPIGPNDKTIIDLQIKFTKKNIIGHRHIYLISGDPTLCVDGCTTINENIFPFSHETVIKYHGKSDRTGWYLQQLLKLYAGKIIDGILERYLVIDCDTFFLRPVTFIENNKCLYNFGNEHNKWYFEHMSRLDNNLFKVDKNKSGICHHMMFETKYIDELMTKIEKNHNDVFYNVFLKLVSRSSIFAGASEYEIYFNYMLKNHNDKIKLRRLSWENVKTLNLFDAGAKAYVNLDYISCHWYTRT
jgi:hypothetical protein